AVVALAAPVTAASAGAPAVHPAGALVQHQRASAAPVDWPQFHRDAAHSGFNGSERTIRPGNVRFLGESWQGVMGDIVDFSSPAIVDGVAYIGSTDGDLSAFDAHGCGGDLCPPLWSGHTGNGIFSSPAVSNGVVYVGSADRHLYAFDANGCGSKVCPALWTGATGQGILESAPAVSNGVVYVGAYDS